MTDYMTTLVEDEGLRLKPYSCTEGKITIGIGRNLDDRGITEAEAYYLCDNDLKEAIPAASDLILDFDNLSDNRKIALVSMVFQMGAHGASKFKNMILAIDVGDFDQAANEMLDSRWAKQTPERANKLSNMMRKG